MVFLNLLLVIIAFMISLLIWMIIGLRWNAISDFFHLRYSYLDLSFILIYFFEQILLAYLIYLKFNPQLVAGMVSIIIITTASVQNKYWESRTQKISEKSIEQSLIIDDLKKKNKEILDNNKNLIESLEKSKVLISDFYLELKGYQSKLEKKR